MNERSLLTGASGSRFALATVLSLLQVVAAPAATRYWRNSVGSSNWNNGANWSSVSAADTNAANNGIPVAAEPVNIANTDGVARTINYDVNNLAIGPLTIDLTGSSTATETLSIAANSLTVNGLVNVGNTGRGNIAQTGGTTSITNSLFIGTTAGSFGGYSLGNTGTLSATGTLNVGVSGTGTFDQSGGTCTISTDLDVGFNASSFGTHTMTGGTFSTSGSQYIGYSATGNQSQSGGAFIHSGGTNTVGAALVIGLNAGSTGAYTLSGGGALNVVQSETIGSSGKSTFTQTGGTHTINASATFLKLGVNAGSSGTYNLSGTGVLTSNVAESIGVAGLGEFIQNGGTHTIVGSGHNLMLGNAAAAPTATYTLNSGNLTVSQSAEQIGYAGAAAFVQNGGTNSTSSLQIAVGSGVTASYTLSAGGLSAADQQIGGAGNGTLTQAGGVNVASFISVGSFNANTSTGTYNLNGGTATSGFVSLGIGTAPNATGTLTVSGSAVLSLTNILTVYNSGSTSLNLSGGTINAASLNFNGVPSRFNWTTGKLNLTQDVTWDSGAAVTTTSAAFGTSRTLSASQTLMVTGNETLGGTGLFSLTLGSGSTHHVTGNLTIASAGTLTQNAGSTLYTSTITQTGGTVNGTLQSQGNFVYQSGLFNGRLINLGTASLGTNFIAANGVENDGTITLSTGQTLTANGAGLDNLGTLTLSRGTISGSGPAVNNLGGTLKGQGTIDSTFTNHGMLLVDGLLRFNGATATNNGIVRGSGTIIGNFANASGGTLDLTTANLLAISGVLDNDADGLTEWTNAGLVSLAGSTVLSSGQILNSGTVSGAGTVNARLTNSGVVRATGGQLTFGGSGNTNKASGLIQAATGSTVMVLSGLDSNSGTIGLTGGAFDNNNHALSNPGVINGYGTIRTSGLTNPGKLNVGEGNMDVFGSVTNNGSVGVEGGRTIYFFGNVSGAGSFTGTGTAVFLAAVSPGNSPAAVSFGGNATLGAASALNIELGGTAAGSGYDQLLVTGALSIGGVLNVSLINGFSPTAGQSFDILNWGSLSGTFATLNLPTLPGLAWNTSQLYTSGVLSVVVSAGIPGDYNNNGTIDAGDYVSYRKYAGTTRVLPNDPNGGAIGNAQYTTWRTNFGKPLGSGTGLLSGVETAIPEPTGASLIAIGLTAFAVRRKHSRSRP